MRTEDFDWTQYSIIRVPYELLPKGFMDADQVARSKATVHTGIYQMEYGACFTRDSQGFFKRSLIESCVLNNDNIINDSSGNDISFEAVLMGKKDRRYIFGVDPASEVDNFSIGFVSPFFNIFNGFVHSIFKVFRFFIYNFIKSNMFSNWNFLVCWQGT